MITQGTLETDHHFAARLATGRPLLTEAALYRRHPGVVPAVNAALWASGAEAAYETLRLLVGAR